MARSKDQGMDYRRPEQCVELKAPKFGAFGSHNFEAAFHENAFYILYSHNLYRIGEAKRCWRLPAISQGNYIGYNWEFMAGLPGALLFVYCGKIIHFSLGKERFTVFEQDLKRELFPRQVRHIVSGVFEWFGRANYASYDEVLDEYGYIYRASTWSKRWSYSYLSLLPFRRPERPLLNTAHNFMENRPPQAKESREVTPEWVESVDASRVSKQHGLRCPAYPDKLEDSKWAVLGSRYLGLERYSGGWVRAYRWE